MRNGPAQKEVGAGVIVRRMLCMTCRVVGIHQLAACAALARLYGDVMMNDDVVEIDVPMMIADGELDDDVDDDDCDGDDG